MKVNNALAKALYDNKAECSDELAFRRGDILTVLEQHVVGSEGWWRCSLHGRQGLAPANRLQLLAGPQALPPPAIPSDAPEPPVALQNIYQVPSVPKGTASSSTYEKMEGWVTSPARAATLPAQGVYQVPALAAQLLSEKTRSSTQQHLFTLPRACRASVPNITSEVYDVPSMQSRESLLTQVRLPSVPHVPLVPNPSPSHRASEYSLRFRLRASAAAGNRRHVSAERRVADTGSPEKAATDLSGENKKLNKSQQLKQVFKQYGAVGVSFHVGISLISLGIFYVAVSSGVDMTPVLFKLGFSESSLQSKMAAGTSTFVLAYAIHKLFAPVRISITVVSVPFVVRYCRKIGFFKPPAPKP
ncbi:protein FAM210B, mitochondrial [Meleagris gallopavo]|uniref:protein FAM210B, mitochondrial n=1 Tax=Meleagris gallopavo TaxID=9103 RepID=UPI0012AC17AD|nr:protein FAM210B, mitochondrial [Meleagris gallopavo]